MSTVKQTRSAASKLLAEPSREPVVEKILHRWADHARWWSSANLNLVQRIRMVLDERRTAPLRIAQRLSRRPRKYNNNSLIFQDENQLDATSGVPAGRAGSRAARGARPTLSYLPLSEHSRGQTCFSTRMPLVSDRQRMNTQRPNTRRLCLCVATSLYSQALRAAQRRSLRARLAGEDARSRVRDDVSRGRSEGEPSGRTRAQGRDDEARGRSEGVCRASWGGRGVTVGCVCVLKCGVRVEKRLKSGAHGPKSAKICLARSAREG